ncbi:MAG TPA: ABC transporter ATP-binding protein [Usitatibacter sp.]|nr:ABC transporter ATP-binding protein [Usitatibacter sp.]
MALPRVLEGERRGLFARLVLNGILQAAGAVATALLVHRGFDRLVLQGHAANVQAATALAAAFIAAILGTSWLRWRSGVDAERLGQDYVHAMRMRLFRHATTLGGDGTRQMSNGVMMLRFVGDLTAIRNWVSLGLARLIVDGLGIAIALAVLAVVHPVIAAAVTVSVLAAAAVALAIGPSLRGRTREARRRRGRIAAIVNDRIARMNVVEAFGQEERELRRVERASSRLYKALVDRAWIASLLRALSEASAAFASMCALLVGSLQVAAGRATPGAVVAAMVVSGLLAPRLRDLGRVFEYWNAAAVARDMQARFLALRPMARPVQRNGREAVPEGASRIELRHVGRPPVLADVSLAIEPGERVAVIGGSASGKSTLLRLIGGILQPAQGEVLLDGRDIRAYRWSELRCRVAMVSPELGLLRGSLRLNLTYGAGDVDEPALARVVALCQLQPLVARLERGLDTRLTGEGAGLSTGERTRVAIARALMARPSVLLLDETEAHLDRPAREALDALVESFPGTIVFVTHDPARVKRADRAFEARDGGVTELDVAQAVARLGGTDHGGVGLRRVS